MPICVLAVVCALVSVAHAEQKATTLHGVAFTDLATSRDHKHSGRPATAAGRPARSKKPANLLAALNHRLKGARKKASHLLRLDEAVLELSGTVATGKRGWWSVDVSPKVIFSGSKTGNRPTQFAMAPAVTGQAYVATAGVGYIPGFERPITRTFGCGPFNFRPYDPIHHSAYFGLSIPLIGSVLIGPKLIGASRMGRIPWAPMISLGAGVYFSHPWLEPITGRLWNLGLWLVNKGKPIGIKLRAFVRSHPQIGRVTGRVRKLRDELVRKGKPVVNNIRDRIRDRVHAPHPRIERVAGRVRKLGKKFALRRAPARSGSAASRPQ